MNEIRPGRPRDPGVDDRIRGAAAELLLERGMDGTTVDAVAERAGVGKASVYRRWSGKDELALAAFDALVEREVPQPDTGSFEADLTQIIADLLELASGPGGESFFRLAAAESARDPRIADIYRRSLASRLEHCAGTFDRAIERGELHPDVDRQTMFDWPLGLILVRVLIGSGPPAVSEANWLARATIEGMAGLPRES